MIVDPEAAQLMAMFQDASAAEPAPPMLELGDGLAEVDEPVALDADALVVESEAEPALLTEDSLIEAPTEESPIRSFARELPGLDLEGDGAGAAQVEDVPPMEGLETTYAEPRPSRRGRSEKRRRARNKAEPTDFVMSACPSCGETQPQPAPSFCEACGTRLRKPGAKRAFAGEASKRCGECGLTNRQEAVNCTNCGTRIPA